MKLYLVMRKNCATLPINCVDWLGSNQQAGVRAYLRLKDAWDSIYETKYPGLYRVVTFDTRDRGKDGRRKSSWTT